MLILAYIVWILLTIVTLAFYGRVIVWLLMLIVPDSERIFTQNVFYRTVFNLSEPAIAPFRRLVPMSGSIDFLSFIMAIISLNLVRTIVGGLAQARFFI